MAGVFRTMIGASSSLLVLRPSLCWPRLPSVMLHRVGAYKLSIRSASGPVRYNPQLPQTSRGANSNKPFQDEESGIAELPTGKTPVQRRQWGRAKRAPKKHFEKWGFAGHDEGGSGRGDDAGTDSAEDFANAEINRLKLELKPKESSVQRNPQAFFQPIQSLQAEKEIPLVEVSEYSTKESSSRSISSLQPLSHPQKEKFILEEATSSVPVSKQVGLHHLMQRNRSTNSGEEAESTPAFIPGPSLFYGDGRKFEGDLPDKKNTEIELSNSLNVTLPAKKHQFKGSGIFFGDGRKYDECFSEDNSLNAVEGGMEDQNLGIIDSREADRVISQEKIAAKNYALRLLGNAPQTAHKLRQKLTSRSVSENVINLTISDLQRCGLQCDLEYAEVFARSRWRSSSWGPWRLKQELRQRGVSQENIEKALHKVFNSREKVTALGDEVEEGRWGMTKEASEHLLDKARMQWGRGGNLTDEARKRRMIGWLQRRGFNWSIISPVLTYLKSQD